MNLNSPQQQPTSPHHHPLPSLPLRQLGGYWPERFALPQGYSMLPSSQQLFAMGGRCSQLSIRNRFGSVRWSGAVDLSSLKQPLSQTVHIADQLVEVYLNDCGKPPLNFELNRPCIATFIARLPMNITNLVASCRQNGTRLLSASSQKGKFTVAIPHFTRYQFNSTNNDDSRISSKPHSRSHRSLRNLNEPSDRFNRSRVVEYEVPKRATNPRPIRNNIEEQAEKAEEGKVESRVATGPPLSEDSSDIALRSLAKYIASASAIDEMDKNEYDFQNVAREKLVEIDNINKAKMKYTVNNRDVPVLSGCMYAARGLATKITNLFSTTQKIEIKPPTEAETTMEDSQPKGFQALLRERRDIEPINIGDIIVCPDYAPEVRRTITLYAILFEKELYFDIFKDPDSANSNSPQYQIQVRDSPLAISELKRIQMIKNWLAWVIQQNYSSKDIDSFFEYRKSLVMAPLATRRPETILNQLLINNRFDDAEIIANLECREYRRSLKDYKMESCLELSPILDERLEDLKCSNWLVSLGVVSWYFFQDSFINNLKKVVDSTRLTSIPFGIEMRLFQLYLFKQKSPSNAPLFVPLQPSRQQLICHWLLSNRFPQIYKTELSYNENSSKRFNGYDIYRNKLFQKLASLMQREGRDLLMRMIEWDNHLSKEEKQIFHSEIVDDSELEEASRSEKEADLQIEKSRYFQALELLVNIPQWSRSVTEKIIKIVTLPQMLFNYKKSVNVRLCQILKDKEKDFWDVLIILNLPLDVPFTSNQLIRLLQILQGQSRFSPFITEKGRNFILHFLQKRILQALILKKPLWNQLLKNGSLLEEVKKAIKSKVETLNKIEKMMSSQAFLTL